MHVKIRQRMCHHYNVEHGCILRCELPNPIKLLAHERNLVPRKQRPGLVLRALSLRIGDEREMHTRQLRVRVHIDLELGEEAHRRGRETERHDARDASGGLHVARTGGEDEAVEITEPGENELDEGAEELEHLGAGELDLGSDGCATTCPASDGLYGFDDLDTLAGMVTSSTFSLSRKCTEDHEWEEKVLPADERVLVVDVQHDLLELDHVLGSADRRGLFPNLGATDREITPVLRVRVLGVVLETDIALGGAGAGFMGVGQVHDVVLQGMVVVLFQPARVGIPDDEVLDMRTRDAALVELETPGHSRREAGAPKRGRAGGP
jgi:hypothetical protein